MAFAKFHRGKQLCFDGDLENGLQIISEALEERPREILFLTYKASFLYEARKYREAVRIAERVLKVKSKDVWANNVCFDSAFKIGDLEKCRAVLQKIKKLRCARRAQVLMKIPIKEQDLEEYSTRRASLRRLLQQNNSVDAIREAERCLLKGRYDSEVLQCKLLALLMQKRYDDAERTLESVLPVAQEMTSFEQLVEIVGNSQFSRGRIDEAGRTYLSFASERTQHLAWAVCRISNLKKAAEGKLQGGSSEEAVGKLEEALQLLGTFPATNINLSIDLQRLLRDSKLATGRSDESVTIALKAIETVMETGNYDAVAQEIREALPLIRQSGHTDQAKLCSQLEKRLEDVTEAARISALPPNNWTSSRVLLALKASKKDSETEILTKYKTLAGRYHPDKHATESAGWQRMYNILMQEATNAKERLLRRLAKRQDQVGVKKRPHPGFYFDEAQWEINEEAKRRKQAREQEQAAKKNGQQ